MLELTRQKSKRATFASPSATGKTIPWAERLRAHLRDNGAFYLMIAPGVLLVLVFAYMPMPGIIIAFKNYKFFEGISGSAWVGFNNFIYLFKTGIIWPVVANTVLMNLLFIATGTAGSLTVAILMNEIHHKFRARVYQSAMLFPNFISWVLVSYFVFIFLSSGDGVINHVLGFFGIKPVGWYNEPQYWRTILVIVNMWKHVGFGSLIYLSAILGISPELFEVAAIDGASKWQQVRYIMLPMLVPQIVFMILISLGRILSADFGLFFFVPRNSGPIEASRVTRVFDTFVYSSLRSASNLGQAGAAGLLQSICGFFLVMLSNSIVRKVQPERRLF